MEKKINKVFIKGNIHKNLKYIEVDGKTFLADGNKETDKIITFREFDIGNYKKLVEQAAEKISKKTNIKEIIKQALMDLPVSELLEVKKELEKPKPRIRNNSGCVSISVGKTNIPIRN